MDSKNELITSGRYAIFLEMKKEFYKNGFDSNDLTLYEPVFSPTQAKECQRIYNNNHQRKKRNLKDIAKWCFAIDVIPHYKNYKIIFGTLNFNDKALNDTTEKTRRVMVSRYLRADAENYMANIDFGEKNGREHYHFLAFTRNKFDIKKWKYGGGKFIQIPITKKDIKSVKNYILKLNNHAYKESTKLNRVIKDKKFLLDDIIETLYFQEFKNYKTIVLDI